MKKLLALLLALVMILGMVACTKTDAPVVDTPEVPGNSDAPVADDLSCTLTLAHHRTDLEPQLNQVIEEFNEIYPNIKIELEVLADYTNAIAVRAAGDELPDIFELQRDTLPEDEWANYVAPINNSTLAGKTVAEEYFTVDGNLYALSASANYTAMYYNKDVWAKAGVTEVPTSWDEFVSDLQKIKESGNVTPLTSQYKTSWAVGYWNSAFAKANIGPEYTKEWAATDAPFSDERMTNVLDALRELNALGLMEEDLMSSDWDLQAADFPAGLIGTYLAGSYITGTMDGLGMDSEKMGAFPIPNPNGGDSFVGASGDRGLCIAKSCENYDAALLFVDFCTERFAEIAGMISPLIGAECEIPCINELMSYNPVLVQSGVPDADYTAIKSLVGYSDGAYVQEYLIAEDPAAVVEKYDEMWKNARVEYFK